MNKAAVRIVTGGALVGYLDGVQGRLVEGWVWSPAQPHLRLSVCVLAGDRVIGECVASQYRVDLASAGIGDGRYSFSFKLPLEFLNGEEHHITAMVKGSDFVLPGGPKSVVRSIASLSEAMKNTKQEASATSPLSDFEFTILHSLARISENLSIQTRALHALLEQKAEGPVAKPATAGSSPASASPSVSERSLQEKYGALIDRAIRWVGSHDIILFSIIDWHFRIQRPQHLSTELARQGFRIFYLSVKFEELKGPSDERFFIRSELVPGVFEVQLRCSAPVPNIYNGVTDPSQLLELCLALRELNAVLGLRNPIALMQFPSWLPMTLAIPGITIVHDCLDHVAGFSNVSDAVVRLEDDLLEKADLVVTSSEYLHDVVARKRPNEIVRNAAEVSFFSQQPSETAVFETGPVIGYFGAISDWFDVDLVRDCAVRHPDWRFFLIGSTVGADTEALASLPNVELLGEKPYQDLPHYLYAFDVCIIPFKLPELIKATNPVKVYEYLCSGKPVVSTCLPEVELIGPPLVYVAKTSQEFPRLIETAMEERNASSLARKRLAFAKKNSWVARGKRYAHLLRTAFPNVSVVVLCYNNLSFTRACIESILTHSNYPNYELICVDNGSADGTAAYLSDLAAGNPAVKAIINKDNLGFARGNNVGIKAATGDYVIILNNDTYVTPGWIVDLIRPMRLDPKVGMTGPVTNLIGNEQKIAINYTDMDEMRFEALKFTEKRRLRPSPTESLAFFCLAIRQRVVREVGLLEEEYSLSSFNHDDYCRKVIAAGFKLVVAGDVFVHRRPQPETPREACRR